MGRRKIEIRAIKDDRNRSVTFLKRKGGLFKKAYELSVLCSVDVAVIIFGHNKKLYEFSSGDINETLRRYQYYGQPHEHKGPVDFKNKGGGGGDDDDDDDDDAGDDAAQGREESLPPPHSLPPQLHHNSFAHIGRPMASVSPPMPNGMFQPRHGTPQPPHMISRPPSQNMIRRTSSNLVPMAHPHPTPPPPQNGFAYVPNPPIYNPQATPPIPPQPSPQPQFQPFSQPQQPPQPPPQTHQQLQQAHQQYLTEQRRHSQPPPVSQPSLQPPPQPQQQPRASPQPESQNLRPPEQASPPQPKHLSSKSRSIFTPIDEGGSVLAQHFFGAPDPKPRPKGEEDLPAIKPPPRSITVSAPPRPSSQPSRPQGSVPEFAPPSRTNTSGSKSGARPKLNLQIPSEAEDSDSAVGGSPSQTANASATPARSGEHIVLPPPSPSASTVMSAGAAGPPNPFARPPPPTSNANRDAFNDNRNNNVETPISALPSRYMNMDLLPSPSNFFSEWVDSSRNGLGSAVLPSPLVFPTPADPRGLGFGSRDAAREAAEQTNGEKRKGSIELAEKEGDAKKVKTGPS
ncbi:hypothetical protein G647_03030 [Cladophialophora carrionii CBS 160.54]|uniref:MADS-box domain-containing protein n=1 Tax=Cladophialophora carrionii CBS 160.54 TaxID=1279043 RepID=V9DIV1_9EURO|nr:uncharacterized protein G647_03030 [Cladophialophora carrionii CBS 160.54]ETI26253.1 hypothetical protein G647_03030 [Cladophialophora carrionii CBS 160.54]